VFLLAAQTDPINHVTDVVLLDTGTALGYVTMHMVSLLIAAVIVVWIMTRAAKAISTGPREAGNLRFITTGRLSQLIESITAYLYHEMLVPVMGEKEARRYMPLLMTFFFFILVINLIGLIPLLDVQHLAGMHTTIFGGTATGNIAVTGGLALIAFLVIQVHGFRDLGLKGWLEHLCGGLLDCPKGLWVLIPLVFLVELMGLIIKPAALAIRLFANMVAGHTLMAVLLLFGTMTAQAGSSWAAVGAITLVSGISAVAISFLELFVAFLQAFIFMFLTAVFITLMMHHDDHETQAEEGHEPAPA